MEFSYFFYFFFFSSRRRHTRYWRDWSSDVCSSDLQCGYAYYGKAISLRSAKGKRRAYAYYRCCGSDAYRFGGERLCANPQVRTDRLDEAVWREVEGGLQAPSLIAAE